MIAFNFLREVYYGGISIYDVTCYCDLTGSSLFCKHGVTNEMVEIQQKVKT